MYKSVRHIYHIVSQIRKVPGLKLRQEDEVLGEVISGVALSGPRKYRNRTSNWDKPDYPGD
jgi:hypothetical protein